MGIESISAIIAISVIVIGGGIILYRQPPARNVISYILIMTGILLILVFGFMRPQFNAVDWLQVLLAFALLTITGMYAWSTHRQANASVRIAEETREQRMLTSRPVVIQKAQQKKAVQETIVTDYFSHFEIYNAGNGPAIEPEIFLLDENQNPVYLEDEITYLRAGEAPLKLLPAEFGKVQTLPHIEPPVKVIPSHLVIRENRTYLVSQYQSIFSYGRQPTWYQTWLPFESHKVNGKEEIRLTPGKLEFRDEVSEKERIVMPLVKGKPR
jgi:uncharacterized membrane protein SirB2